MPCRVCTANDREALIDDLARGLWEDDERTDLDPRHWQEAGAYWQRAYRQLAERALDVLERGRAGDWCAADADHVTVAVSTE